MLVAIHGHEAFVYRPLGARGECLPVILIHGAGHDHSVWNFQARSLARAGFRVFAPDLPGHGASQGKPLASIEATADWILALLDAMDLAEAALVGHSMGSLVALETAGRAPARVARLALVGTGAPMPVAPVLLDAAASNRPAAHQMINQWSYTPQAQLGASASPGLLQPALNLRLMERQREGVLHADLAACDAYRGAHEAAARVRCRTLLLCGDRDLMTPPRNLGPLREALAGSAGGVRMCSLAGCGHAIMAEAPDRASDALRGFLSED